MVDIFHSFLDLKGLHCVLDMPLNIGELLEIHVL